MKQVLDKQFLSYAYWVKNKTQREIGQELGLHREIIRRQMQRLNIPKRNRSEAATLDAKKRLKQPNLMLSATISYIIGVILGDGTIGNKKNDYRIGLQTHSAAFNKSFEQALDKIGLNAKTYKYTRVRKVANGAFSDCIQTYYHTSALSKVFVDWFKSLDLVAISKLASEYPSDFLRGFYESEGYFSKEARRRIFRYKERFYTYIIKRERIGVAVTNKLLLDLARELSKQLGFHPTNISIKSSNCHNRKTLYQFEISRKGEARRFIREINPVIKN